MIIHDDGYDEVRYAIYNRLDRLSQKRQNEIIERMGWWERIIEQRERDRIIHLLRGTPDFLSNVYCYQLVSYLEALNRDSEREIQERQ